MNTRDEIVLKKIIQYADEISETISRFNLTQDSFTDDFIARNAISMCILQIGELVGRLTPDFKTENAGIPWHKIRGMRNYVAHEYGSIDFEIVWFASTKSIPELQTFCASYLAN